MVNDYPTPTGYTLPQPSCHRVSQTPRTEFGSLPECVLELRLCAVNRRHRNNGIGFDQIHEKRIFKLFNRLVSDAYEGSGIGLTIAKRIVKKHNGSIKVKSEVGVGSTFLFNLES